MIESYEGKYPKVMGRDGKLIYRADALVEELRAEGSVAEYLADIKNGVVYEMAPVGGSPEKLIASRTITGHRIVDHQVVHLTDQEGI